MTAINTIHSINNNINNITNFKKKRFFNKELNVQEIKELQKRHSNFWSTIAPAALLLNPSLQYNNLLIPNEV